MTYVKFQVSNEKDNIFTPQCDKDGKVLTDLSRLVRVGAFEESGIADNCTYKIVADGEKITLFMNGVPQVEVLGELYRRPNILDIPHAN
jgi:hypothetical protein